MKYIKVISLSILAFITLSSVSCDKNGNVSLFSTQNDMDLGQQVSEQIASDPQNYPILDEAQNQQAYDYLQEITDKILASGEVQYKDEFAWKIHIIDQDVLNAFATPGGYIYVYTGLIKYLDNVDDLAGVMGHELAHADLRHSSRALQRQHGLALLASVVLGEDPSALAQITAQLAGGLAGLKFSRDHESEADARSVDYLSKTPYSCNGAAKFFEKLEAQGASSGQPEFLSTHPAPANRVASINGRASGKGCTTDNSNDNTNGMTYKQFQSLFK